MDWDVAQDVNRNWRRMVGKSRTEDCRRLLEVKRMGSEMVTDVVDSIEAVSVASDIVESIIGTSYVEGEVLAVWRRMESNAAIKSSIKKKLEEEDDDERLLVEAQGGALNDLAASLHNLTVQLC